MRLFALTTLAALAVVAVPAHAEDLNGFYTGVEIGSSNLDARFNNEPLAAVSARQKKRESTFAYGLYGGYGARVAGPIYLGGEVGIGARNGDVNARVGTVNVKLDPGARYTISARLGYQFSPRSMLYVRGGYESRQIDVTAPDGKKSDETFTGGIFGLGYEHMLGQRFSLRGELIGVTQDDKTLRYGVGGASRLKVEPRESRLMLGGSYHF